MNIRTIGVFLLGAVVGAAASWKFAQKKWQTWAEEDIESVKKAYSEKLDKELNTVKKKRTGVKMTESFSNVVEGLGYANVSTVPNDLKKKAKSVDNKPAVNYNAISDDKGKNKVNDIPYVIRDNLFGSEGYEQINLRYDIDNLDGNRTLFDQISRHTEDELKTLGEDVLEYIDNYAEFEPSDDEEEETCVIHVRDDVLKIDYEIDIHRW